MMYRLSPCQLGAAASEFIDINPQLVLDGPIRITRSLWINQVLANCVEVITLSDLFFHNIIEQDSSLVYPDNGFGIEEAIIRTDKA